MAQHEITAPQRLLNDAGNISEPGFAKKLYWKYDRNDIRAPKWRIKEWDYYYIGTQDYGLCLTISDAGFVSSLSVSLLGFGEEPFQWNGSEMGAFPLGKLHMPWTSESGSVAAKVGRLRMSFENDGEKRRLQGIYKDYCKTGKDLIFDVTLTGIPKESMVIATPFEKDRHFYYNQKINCMYADGIASFDGKDYVLLPEAKDYKRIGSGDRFGFNIGYGFGDTSAASENMLFYNGKSHKLQDVSFEIPKKEDGSYDYMKPWTFHETDGRFEMTMTPVIDRQAPANFGVIMMIPHQVFGKLSGKAVLDDGTVIEIRDRMVFAEHVHNKW